MTADGYRPEPAAGPFDGLRALVINPTTGSMHVKRLPALIVQATRLVGDLVGGTMTAIGGGPPAGDEISPGWIAYYDQDAHMRAKAPNDQANTLIRRLGWSAEHGWDPLAGTVVFLGRRGIDEVDVPGYVLALSGIAQPRDPASPREQRRPGLLVPAEPLPPLPPPDTP